MSAFDIARFIDEGEWTPYRRSVVAFVALAIIFDGFELQVLSFAIPQLMEEWSVAKTAFGPAMALGMVGMAIGTTLVGGLGDRFGRRNALVGSVFLFGLITTLSAFAQSVPQLTILRFLAGCALGGALPNATAMAAEFTPLRRRAVAVTLTIVCVPLGGMIGGLLASMILPGWGWRGLFLVAGLPPILLALCYRVWLPESPRYLVRHAERHAELGDVLHRMGSKEDHAQQFTDSSETAARSGIAAIVSRDYLANTLGLWIAFFCCTAAVYLAFGWLPTLLSSAGFSISQASLGLALFNMGGAAGAVAAAFAIECYGSRRIMIGLGVLGVAIALLAMVGPLASTPFAVILTLLCLLGLAVNGVQTTLYALASHLYPAALRGRGVGAALAVGRGGAIAISYFGAVLLDIGGALLFFAVMAAVMAGVIVGLLMIRRHFTAASAQ